MMISGEREGCAKEATGIEAGAFTASKRSTPPKFGLALAYSIFLAAALAASPALATDFYVAPWGSSWGSGAIDDPWNLAFALSQPAAVQPGDTIWLRGGTYSGTFWSNLNGAPDAPIKVRQYPGERATLDGGNSNGANILEVAGSYTWYWGFEIVSTDTNRISATPDSWAPDIGRGMGIATVQTDQTGAGLKFINLVVHDTAGGFGLWKEALGAEVYGCLIYYNGWSGANRGHGHGIYVQNVTSWKRIADNLVFSNFSHGIHAFGSSLAGLNNLDIEGNTAFNNGIPDFQRNLLVGGESVAQNPYIVSNVLAYPSDAPFGQNLNVGYDPYGTGATNPIVQDNTVLYGDTRFNVLNTGSVIYGNRFLTNLFNLPWDAWATNTFSPGAFEPEVIVRPNEYEAGRAQITVVNWTNASSVPVDLSWVLAPGTPYEIRDAQNFFGAPIRADVYWGGTVDLPTWTYPSQPIGYGVPTVSAPFLNVYVLLTR